MLNMFFINLLNSKSTKNTTTISNVHLLFIQTDISNYLFIKILFLINTSLNVLIPSIIYLQLIINVMLILFVVLVKALWPFINYYILNSLFWSFLHCFWLNNSIIIIVLTLITNPLITNLYYVFVLPKIRIVPQTCHILANLLINMINKLLLLLMHPCLFCMLHVSTLTKHLI